MYERKCYQELLAWKKRSHGQTALLIEGARRVGKTTLVEAFTSAEYASHLTIDFSQTTDEVRTIFRQHSNDIDTLLRMLQLYHNVELTPGESAIVFDEVQRFPLAREMVKHLVADGRFDYLETGSLISIKKNVQDIVIPSEEDRIALRPLDFEEYLWAIDRRMLAQEIRACRQSLATLPEALHSQATRLFNEYLVVGGMPTSIRAFARDATFFECDREKRRILALYTDDIAKFGGEDARRALSIFLGIPGQLSAQSKRFNFSTLKKGERFENYESALRWLEDAHMVNVCRLCTDPNVGYKLTVDESKVKVYMGDTGLLVSHAFSDNDDSHRIQRDLQFGRVSANRGMIAENAIAQQLRALKENLFFHTWNEPPADATAKKERPREIDFLLTRAYSDAAGKLRISPVEVKSSKRYSTISLDDFKVRYSKRVGDEIVFHPKQLKVEGRRQYLPLYMAFCV